METVKRPIENGAPRALPSRIITGVPSILQNSSFASPIRSRKEISALRSACSQKSRKSLNRSRVSSPGQSTVGSLRLNSPHCESIHSLQSLSSVRSCTLNNGKNQNRCVILPNEIETLAQFFGKRLVDKNGAAFTTDVVNDEYDASDIADDDSTLNSSCVQSIDDAAVSAYISRESKDSILYNNRNVPTSSPSYFQDKLQNSSFLPEHQIYKNIKLNMVKDKGSAYSHGSPIRGTLNGTKGSARSSTGMDSSPQIRLPSVEQKTHKTTKRIKRSRNKHAGDGIEHLSNSPYDAAQEYIRGGFNIRRGESKMRPTWEL
eukprot:scaffold1862_cov268-Chaetoceros_neogracile.AAC.7